MENLIITLIVGGLAGWIASILVGSSKRQGLILNIIVGIIGAFIGDYVFNLFDIQTEATFLGDVIVATAGAAILLLVLKAIRK
ncbi:MAG: GlsB/YeaQ/YmgE family stress response membrane protein [Actinobacteria bacterium]|nr:GlsB/YeaQ/YmgE family stress response membrane protein [Actinomycetota bacterium]